MRDMRFPARRICIRHLLPLIAHLAIAMFLATATATAGCSTFERRWERAEPEVSADEALVGRWEGTWTSEANEHSGKLRCLVTPTDNGRYSARYHATYFGWMTFEYGMEFEAQKENTIWRFAGEEDLGWLFGGAYRFKGHVDGEQFYATYESKLDHGRFEMVRMAAE